MKNLTSCRNILAHIPALVLALAVILGPATIMTIVLKDSGSFSCALLPCKVVEQRPSPSSSSSESAIASVHSEKHDNSDVLSWTEFAESFVLQLIANLQHPRDCQSSNFIVVEADQSGLLWNFRSFVRALTLGMVLNRTVLPYPRRPGGPRWQYAAFDGCDQRHVGCFFKNITSCSAHDDSTTVKDFTAWDFSCQGSCLEKKWVALSKQKYLYLEPMNGMYPGSGLEVWPSYLTRAFMERPDLFIAGTANPSLFLASSAPNFMLHAIVSKWLFQPQDRVIAVEKKVLSQLHVLSAPIATVHIRRTDKEAEDPFWREHGHQYRGLNSYTDALEEAKRRAGKSWKSVFVMSDSQSAIAALTAIISNMTSPPTMLYDNILDRTVMEHAGGHVNVPSDQKLRLQDHFVACVHLSGQLSSHVIGTLSSNVFKVLLQLVAAHKRLIQVSQLGPIATSLDTSEGWAG